MAAGGLSAAISFPSFMNVANIDAARDSLKLNVALCGLGNYANALQYGLAASQYCRLAGIVTGHAEKAERWKKQYQIPVKNIYNYDNFDSIIDNNPTIGYYI